MRLRFIASVAATAFLATTGCKEKKAEPEEPPVAPSSTSTLTLPPPLPSVPAPADVASPPADAERTPSGLAMKVLEPGKGTQHPEANRILMMSYVGWRKDGVMFDQTPPVELMYRQLSPGWSEGMGYMVEGEKRRLWIPSGLAYGDSPKGGEPAGDLTIDVKLITIGKKGGGPEPVAAAPIAAPDDVAKAPKTAKKTKSGLAYRILTPAKGAQPSATDTVLAQYTGWTPDGKMFDSSVTRGKPGKFGLNHVIPGWTEGLQLMHVGEKARFWIPAALAYGDKPARPGAPAGPLVFDIELVGIEGQP
jgi:peptidylprolyl isomerase